MRRKSFKRAAIALGVGAVSLVGCGFDAAIDSPLSALLPDSLVWEQVAGSDGEALILVRTEVPRYDEADPNRAATTTVARVRLDSAETRDLGGIPASGVPAAVSSGRWLAWEEGPDALHVMDLSSGALTTYSDPAWGYFRPVAIAGDELLVEFENRDATGAVLINLASGARDIVIPPTVGVFGGNTSLVGDSVVWYVYPPRPGFDPLQAEPDDTIIVPIEAASTRGRIERVEIETGNVTTLLEDAAPPVEVGFAETSEGRMAWGHWSDDYSELVLETLQLDSGERKTIARFRDGDVTFHRLMDLGPHGAIIRKTTEAGAESAGDLFQAASVTETCFVGWDGGVQLLLSQERRLLQLALQLTVPRQLGDFAIVRDVLAGDYLVYDVTDGTMLRVRP